MEKICSMLLPILLERAAAVLTGPIDAAAAEMGLLPHEWRILLALHEAPGGLKVSSLANFCLLLQPTTSKHLDKLENMNLLERHHSKKDRRIVDVKLTPEGQSVASNMNQQAKNFAYIEVEENMIKIIENIAMSWSKNKCASTQIKSIRKQRKSKNL